MGSDLSKPPEDTVTVISNAGDGKPRRVPVTPGMMLSEFLTRDLGIAHSELVCTRVNGKRVQLTYPMAGGDILCVTPGRIEAAARMPTMKQFIALLEELGFVHTRNGPGDHQRWKKGVGLAVTVNPDKRDRKTVDIACVKSLAKLLGVSSGVVLQWALDGVPLPSQHEH